MTIVHLNFRTRQSAREALADIEDIRSRVIAERSRIGAQQNRLSVGINNLDISVENRKSAGSQITDVDLAEESVKLLRMNILQQVGSAILTQANQGPALALQLLRS